MIEALAHMMRSGRSAFVIHGNADPDALASAFVLSTVFRGSVVMSNGLDRASKLLAKRLGIDVKAGEDLSAFDRIVVLDTSGPEQLGELSYLGDDEEVVVIDHHTWNSNWSSKSYHCDDSKSSCCEIVYEIVKASGSPLRRDAALALLAGMLTDSGHFRYGNAQTLATFAEIMRAHDISMHEALSLIEAAPELSEKISQLKGAQRLRYRRVEEFIIAVSQGSAFEASVCRSLISLGADIAFVGSQRGEQFRISARAVPDVVEMGLHLGKILEGIGNETSNGGGGHPAAAGLSGRGDVRNMLDLCVSRSRRVLRSLISKRERGSPPSAPGASNSS